MAFKPIRLGSVWVEGLIQTTAELIGSVSYVAQHLISFWILALFGWWVFLVILAFCLFMACRDAGRGCKTSFKPGADHFHVPMLAALKARKHWKPKFLALVDQRPSKSSSNLFGEWN